jgi:hypothetical protein
MSAISGHYCSVGGWEPISEASSIVAVDERCREIQWRENLRGGIRRDVQAPSAACTRRFNLH